MSWDQLRALAREGEAARRNIRDNPPLGCPNDGEALLDDGKGGRRCPAGDYHWPADRRGPGAV